MDRAAAYRAPRWTWALVVAAFTAAVVILAVAVVIPALQPGAGARPVPQRPPGPPAPVEVLDAAGVESAVRAVRDGQLGPRTVVTSAGVDSTVQPEPRDRACDPDVRCAVIGVLEGLDPAVGTVAVAEREGIKAIPLAAAELRGPVALRITAAGPLELLGHVDLAESATGAVDVAGLRALEPAIPDGRVAVVDGWLAGVNAPSCGPVDLARPPAPFDCLGLRAFLADEPTYPATLAGRNGVSVIVPPSAARVQAGAYQEFAVLPVSPGASGNDEPRYGRYLVRLVVADTRKGEASRGWLMVGRLDPRAGPAATDPSPAP